MDTDVRSLIRVGRVSSVNAVNCTARVTFDDEDDLVSAELPVIVPCSKDNKAYWLPDIDTQVLCLFLPAMSGKGCNDGFVVGAFYSDVDAPKDNSATAKSIRFKDGSYVHFDGNGNIQLHATGSINISANGNITINGARIDLN